MIVNVTGNSSNICLFILAEEIQTVVIGLVDGKGKVLSEIYG